MVIDKSIPYKNIIMRCDYYTKRDILLPEGFVFREYQVGDEYQWAKLETEIQDFDTYENAVKYFRMKYLSNLDELQKRMICVEAPNQEVVGMVIAWLDGPKDATISTVHWLVTSPRAQGFGIGKALIKKLQQRFYELGEYPIYLHTQPWSYAAICIYSSLGFRMLKKETILHYENQYDEAIAILKTLLSADKLEKLINESI